jgi:uncharacterized protein (TIGR03089 family)
MGSGCAASVAHVPNFPTLARVFEHWLADRPSRPLITYYGPSDTRIELSTATAANAINKATNLFADELLLDPGDVVWFRLPCHWQAPLLALGAWSAGLTIDIGADPPADAAATLAVPGLIPDEAAGIQLAVSLHPWGLPLGSDTPADWQDAAAMTRSQPDQATATWPADPQAWLRTGAVKLRGSDLLARGRELGLAWALPRDGRLLTSLPPTQPNGLLSCTVAPAMAAGSVIMVESGEYDHISRQEGNHSRAVDV